MASRWHQAELDRLRHENAADEDLLDCAYLGRVVGADPAWAMHGGGNVSLKKAVQSLTGETIDVLYMKSTGRPLGSIDVDDLCPLRLEPLRALRSVDAPDAAVAREILSHRLRPDGATPSIETLLHALLPPRFLAHTHPECVLALGNRVDGFDQLRDALEEDVIVLPYAKPGLALSQAAAAAFEQNPRAAGLILQNHGLLTWGDSAREAYDRTVELVARLELFLEDESRTPCQHARSTTGDQALERYRRWAPHLRRALAKPTADPDRRWQAPILRPLLDEATLETVALEGARRFLDSPPLTSDQIIRVGPLPLWLDIDPDSEASPERIQAELEGYARRYRDYVARHAWRLGQDVPSDDVRPRVILWPGVGAVCQSHDETAADIVRDITAQALRVKRTAAEAGGYLGLSEEHVFDMEFCPVQRQKLAEPSGGSLDGRVALVTGAMGAIGSAVCEGLQNVGAHVVVTDLAFELSGLDSGARRTSVPLDVTDEASIAAAFDHAIGTFGGVDIVVVNAGLAHVSSLMEMDAEDFRRLERVNVEGTLLVLAEAGRRFAAQGLGGDVVLISTKNVFAPGKDFGAYSATKAAAHQLARVASLELAPLDVRVNMVAPDAVFAHGDRASGLWSEVGPSRMKARGQSESELHDYYRRRNLLQSEVRAEHVARAVLFFVTRQTPTTGATLPVDGGLPDATPR